MKRIILAITVVAMFAIPSFASAHVWPLTMQQARFEAKNRAWLLHPQGGVTNVKSTWCDQWSAWKIDCGAEADGSVYSYKYDISEKTFCIVTVDVRKDPLTGFVSTRVENNRDCSGAYL
jgi:hypothetical protein